MTAKEVLDAVEKIDGQDIGKGTKAVLDALVKDGEDMSKRMTSLEEKVDAIDRNVVELKTLIQTSINQKQSGWKFLSELIKEPKFWLWIIILTVLAYGVSIADLKGLIGVGK
jgi:t-SNARE complex subunit (syntaxin)